MRKIITVATLLLRLDTTVTFAQSDPKVIMKAMKEFYATRTGAPFATKDEWKCLNETTINLYKTNRPAVLFLGFSGCHPCRNGLPYYANVSNDKVYNNVDLVYMTFDDSATVMDEMNDAKIAVPNNIKVVCVSKQYIDSNKIARGYPVVYFMDKNKIVQYMYGDTGQSNARLDSMGYWQSMLDKIK